MGLFRRKPKESYQEIYTRIKSSEAGEVFLKHFINELSPGEEWYSYLIADAAKRNVFLSFEKKGVIVEFLNFRLRGSTYTEKSSEIGFGASGYADLPNSDYVMAFYNFIKDSLALECPHLTVKSGNGWQIVIGINESAKKGW